MKVAVLNNGKFTVVEVGGEVSEEPLPMSERWKAIRKTLDALTSDERANALDYIVSTEERRCRAAIGRAGKLAAALDRTGEAEWMRGAVRDLQPLREGFRSRQVEARLAALRLDMYRVSAAGRLRQTRHVRGAVIRKLSELISKKK